MSHKEDFTMDNAELELAKLRAAPITPKIRLQIPPQDMPAQNPGTWTKIHDPIRRKHRVLIVLDNDDRVAKVSQPLKALEQTVVVTRM